MGRTEERMARKIVVVSLLLLGATAGAAGWMAWRYPHQPHRLDDEQPIRITIARGMSAGAIARALRERDLIDRPSWFRIYATERGFAQRVQAGQYTFRPSMAPAEILAALVKGVPDEVVWVTLPEGKSFVEMAVLLDEAGVCAKPEFLSAARDPVLLGQLGIVGDSVEGYLFPARYDFRPHTSAPKVIARLVKELRQNYADLATQHRAGLAQLHKNHHFDEREIVLMASLVEKETAEVSERPRIAGLFLNRLRLPTFVPHLLQTDPTIVYGCTVAPVKSAACREFSGRIRRAQLDDRENSYNTYTHEGLPPGPICNPGAAALEAVMAPETTPYLYFVSKNDGTHYFSKTRAEHEAAVDRYQRGHTGP